MVNVVGFELRAVNVVVLEIITQVKKLLTVVSIYNATRLQENVYNCIMPLDILLQQPVPHTMEKQNIVLIAEQEFMSDISRSRMWIP